MWSLTINMLLSKIVDPVGEALVVLAPVVAVAFSILALVESTPRDRVRRMRSIVWYRVIWVSSVVYFVALIGLCLAHAHGTDRLAAHDYINMGSLVVVLLLLQVVRLLLGRRERPGYGGARIRVHLADLTRNVVLFVLCYATVLSDRGSLIAAGVILAGFNAVRVLKYRIYDDIYCRGLYQPDSPWLRVPNQPGHVLLRGLVDMLPRAYFYTVFSSTILQLHLLRDGFCVTHASGNEFVDFLYFNVVTIATVGYGDIFPTSAGAKLFCAGEILYAFIVLAAISGALVGRFLQVAHQPPTRNRRVQRRWRDKFR